MMVVQEGDVMLTMDKASSLHGGNNTACTTCEPLQEEAFLTEAGRQYESGRLLVLEVLARLDAGRAALQDTLHLLKEVAAVEGAHAKAYKKVEKERMCQGEGPTLKNAAEAVCTYTPEVARAFAEFASSVKKDVERVSSSSADLANEQHELIAESRRLHVDLQNTQESMSKALQAHKKAYHCDQSTREHDDPWLTQRALSEAHSHVKKALTTYRSRLLEFFDKVKILDAKQVDTLKALLQCYTAAVEALATKTQKHVDTLTAAFAAIEPEVDIASFQKTLSLVNLSKETPESSNGSSTGGSLSDANRSVNALLESAEVRKKGPVLRMGQVTGQWKEGILVLTRSGFVHWCHEEEDLLVPVTGATLPLCSVEVTSPQEFCVTETERLGKLSLLVRPKQRTLAFKVQSSDDCAAWIVALKEAIVESSLESLF